MPSIRSLLSYAAISVLASSQLLSASPVPSSASCEGHGVSTPTLPSTGAATQLPPPSANVTLKHVTLGRGVQNYTCASSTAVPVAIGAVATLFDITPLAYLFQHSPLLTSLPVKALSIPLPVAASIANISIPSTSSPAVIGKHYFTAAGVPTFDLYTIGEKLSSVKVASIPAPATANVGPAGTGAVAWLKLDDQGGSVGLKEVYRVVTAGGNPPASCAGVVLEAGGVFSVQYAAEYWFYG